MENNNEINTPDTAKISVSAMIFENGKILLEDHVKCNAWTLPGGKLNPGEDEITCIIRELHEELGITVDEEDLALQFTTIFKCEYPTGSGNYQWFDDWCFMVYGYSGEIQNLEPEKHKELRFVDPDDIHSMKISQVLKAALNKYIERSDAEYDGTVSPDDIVCSGYTKDLGLMRCLAKPEIYQELLDALGIEFDVIPKLEFVAGNSERVEVTQDTNGRSTVSVYLDTQQTTMQGSGIKETVETAIYLALMGLIKVKYPSLEGNVAVEAIAAFLVYGAIDKATECIQKLISKFTIKGLLEKLTTVDIETLYKEANGTIAEAKEITAQSLANSIKYRTGAKYKRKTASTHHAVSDLMEKIKNSLKIDTSVKYEPKNVTPTTTPKSSSDDSEENVSESMLRALSEGSYIINGDYVTILEDSTYDPQLRRILYKERIVKRKDILALLDRVKADVPYIKYAYPDLNRFSQKNLFIDLYYYNEAFFKNNDWNNTKSYKLYRDFLTRLIQDKRVSAAGYTRKTVMIPILDWHKNPNTRMWMYREDINPMSIIYEMMMKDPNGLKDIFKGCKVLFLGKDKYFTVDFEDTANMKKTAVKFRIFITKILKGEEFDAEDVDGTEDAPSKEAIKADIIDKVETSKGVDLTATNAKLEKEKKESEKKPVTSKNKPKVVPNTTVPDSTPAKKKTTTTATTIKPKPVKPVVTKVEEPEEEIEDDEEVISKARANQPDNDFSDAEDEEIKKAIMKAIDVAADDAVDTDDALDNLDNDEIAKELLLGLDSMNDDSVNINAARATRMSTLDKELLDKNIKGRSVKEILDNKEDPTKPMEIPETSLPVASPNEEWQHMSYMNFDKTYDMEKDIVNAFRHFSNVSRPLVIRNITVTDNSTSEDRLDLYVVDYEDYRGKRYTVKLDIPKVRNNRFLLRGNAKQIQAQFFNMPIIKTSTDVCQVVTNYKKIIISRYNTSAGKSLGNTGRFIKAANKYKGNKIKFNAGDNSLVCNKYVLPIDYIDLSSVFSTIETDEYKFYFNQDEIRKEYEVNEALGVPYALDKKNKAILYYPNTEKTPFVDILVSRLTDHYTKHTDFYELFSAATAPSKGTYTRAKIMGSEIPLIVVLGYYEGLSKILKKANITYTLEDKLTSAIRTDLSKDWIRFDDGYLVYNVDYSSSLLMNGLKDCDTISHSITDIDNKNMYLDFLDEFGGRIKADGLDNFYDCEIDPITEEVLAYYKLPTDYISVLIYANYLLSDNKFIKHTDTSSRRTRRFELVAAYTYQVLAESYGNYANSLKHNRNAAAFTCKQSAVIDKILLDPTSSDYSVINVLNDVECSNAITTKGLSGLNADRSYSLDKRTFDPSMEGVVGMSTGFSGNVGITRQATLDSNIQGARGYVKDNKGKTGKLNGAQILTATEAMNPMSSTRDDSTRLAMTFIQSSKHAVRTAESDPLLVTNGTDEAIGYMCSDQFAFKAKGNGKVTELTEDNMIITYDDGSKDFINLRNTIQKNSDGGFYVPLKLDADDKLKVGSKVKSNQIVAYDKSSFSNSLGESDNIAFNSGKLAKIGIINTDDGFEDTGIITSNMAEKLACEIVYKHDCVLDKMTNVYNIAKVGQKVEQGDTLLVWQTPYDEEEVNNLLKALADDREAVSELGKHVLKSEVTGEIVDIKVYRTVDTSELSDSIKKYVTAYEKPISELKKHLKEEGIEDTDLPANYPLQPTGKLKGAGDGILIEFYVKTIDILGVGDKVTYDVANKAVITNVIPKGQEPYTAFRPNEEISALVSVTSISKRLVTSTIIRGSLSKLMIELDRSCKDIAGIPYDDSKV